MTTPSHRKLIAEAIGTLVLVVAVIGSGIAAQRLSPGDVGLQLLENAVATGAALTALILALQPVSAAFNPIITLIEAAEKPKILTTEAVKASDVVITMGCGDACPFYPGKRYEDWTLNNRPAKESTSSDRSVTRSAVESSSLFKSSLTKARAQRVHPRDKDHPNQDHLRPS